MRLQTIFAARAAESVQHTVTLTQLQAKLLRLSLPWHEKHIDSRLTRMTVDVDSLARFLQKRSCQRGHQHRDDGRYRRGNVLA
ncbi:ATP-binding protein [Salmonella enterica subsp. enterica]|uniref:ATP-binding protein n=1 Tax=Salmonella enterica I TaxID=59201 RepID=A0A3S4IQX8_SALET|nr:ATP-binding protein [Salmonella enterica subsp. enterica]